ncbi:MAG: pyridoxamine 5'-phosphate oxidase [Balneolaceae bacterium]
MGDLNVAGWRSDYHRGALTEDDLPEYPFPLIAGWLQDAVDAEVPDPNAMALATVDDGMQPDVRIVLLKGVEPERITFFTNYESAKASDLEAKPGAACCIWWPPLERQVRISGPVTKVSRKESEAYFASRPRESQIGAWASRQSSVVSGRKELEEGFKAAEKRFEGKVVPLPDWWGGYEIRYDRVEFWQGRAGRLHDRILYTKADDGWNRNRLSP